MKLSKGIESHREAVVGLWDLDRKSFFKPTLNSAPFWHPGGQSRAAIGSCQGQNCIMIEKMYWAICVGISNT